MEQISFILFMDAAVEWPSIECRLHFGALTDIRVDSDVCVDDSCYLFSCQDTSSPMYFPPFPNSLSAPPVRTKAERPTSISPPSMLHLLATHVDRELSFGSSSNQPLSYCSEKRSFHLQLENERFFSASIGELHVIVGTPKKALRHSHSGQASALGRRRGFLSDRKYRYHPRTQADVANCWPC